MTIHSSSVGTLVVLTFGFVGCVGANDPSIQNGAQATTSANPNPLPPASPEAYRLPWTCGHVYAVTQGNHGDECGQLGNHLGVEEFAWDFGLPLRTPVLAARGGVVTLASTPSPPGSDCYAGCPNDVGGANLEQEACCARCLFSSNKVSVEHADGAISSYSHLDEVVVKTGQQVAIGELLGYSGTSGCSTGPHLHFQIMAGCPTGYCQSLPMTFDDAGQPACGSKAISQNSCR